MELEFEDLDDGVRRINLRGRMDMEGTSEIDLKFTSLAASRQGYRPTGTDAGAAAGSTAGLHHERIRFTYPTVSR
jgi:hypothetical protein